VGAVGLEPLLIFTVLLVLGITSAVLTWTLRGH